MLNIKPEMLEFERILTGKRILVTGHSGFTGSWVCLWLHQIGAKVYGFSLPPITEPSLYNILGIDNLVSSEFNDICDLDKLKFAFKKFQPDLVLHLAAQPLVRKSYVDPILTFTTNAVGTAHVLEAARLTESVKGVVCVTTDKVYKNKEWLWPYRENDTLGGKDPYSASKSAAEMIIDSYQHSFGKLDGSGMAIATARGGNIIGGGDWSEDRLIPDFVRAVVLNSKLMLRYPNSIRPWQHVLALTQGYLMLLAGLLEQPEKFARPWNFGPHEIKTFTVREVLEILSEEWGSPELEYMESPLAEACALALDSSSARNVLNWIPAWDTRRVISETANWYKKFYQEPSEIYNFTLSQLQDWRKVLLNQENKGLV